MRILWVTTKAPWPPRDGGRLLVAETVQALVTRGHAIRVLAPLAAGTAIGAAHAGAAGAGVALDVVDAPPRAWSRAAITALVMRRSITFVRHARRPLGTLLDARLRVDSCDAVVVEQPQLVPTCRAAVAGRAPLVLRAQNVEADLWAGLAAATSASALASLVAREARRVARDERRALGLVDRVVALTTEDRARLARDAPRGLCIEVVPPVFPANLPAARGAWPGSPALILLGSAVWPPNRDGARWFVREVWPVIAGATPTAVLHRFDGDVATTAMGAERVVDHPSPAESADAFAPGSVLVVPLRIASGIRMKVLEAWARGVPVIATTAALRGLGVEAGRHALLADTPRQFADAVRALAADPSLAASLRAAGRDRLTARYDPAAVARQWEVVLEPLLAR